MKNLIFLSTFLSIYTFVFLAFIFLMPNVSYAEDTSLDSAHSSAEIQLININSADKKQLSAMKGIGSKKAQRIVDYREEHGPFNSVDDLVRVKGISSKTVEKNRHLLAAKSAE